MRYIFILFLRKLNQKIFLFIEAFVVLKRKLLSIRVVVKGGGWGGGLKILLQLEND